MRLRVLILGILLFPFPVLADAASCQNLTNRLEALDCLSNDYQAVQKELTLAESNALKVAKDSDDLSPIYENQKLLKESITAFSAYRKAECLRKNAVTLSGNLTGGLAQTACQIALTKARIAALKMSDE